MAGGKGAACGWACAVGEAAMAARMAMDGRRCVKLRAPAEVRKQFFFAKKEPKNFYSLGYGPVARAASTNEQEFFGSFFQKRTASFLLLPLRFNNPSGG
jgi:hypothetical protein